MDKKHVLLMIACCLVPIAAIALISLFNIPVKSAIYFVLILMCPLSHLLMMRYMIQDDDHQHREVEHNAHHRGIPRVSKPGKVSD